MAKIEVDEFGASWVGQRSATIADYKERIEELEIAIRAALSFVQGRHADFNDGHAQMVIAALRGALAKR